MIGRITRILGDSGDVMVSQALFVRPTLDDFQPDPGTSYYGGYLTYSHYNYLRPGPIARIKRNRFEAALRLAEDRFGQVGAIDMGCADGILLPSLARHFSHAVGVDTDEAHLATAQKLITHARLSNVQVICNARKSMQDVRAELNGQAYGVMFLLETLEHIGHSPGTMYQDKLQFVHDLFSLLTSDGVIIVSVPKMVGLGFMVKYATQALLRMHKEPIPFGQLLRSGFLRDASQLEPKWIGGHVGFDDLKLRRLISDTFVIQREANLIASRMWMISRR
jgi:2-polyprenyl-3-methyl-5-hydroxy-6-metoxy-1,4-benzoquinol methylase